MITNEQLKQHLLAIEGVAEVEVGGDGYHYQVVIISDAFIGKTTVARQQWVYAKMKDFIISGQLHAINMKTWTCAEWEKQHG